jgi:ubiquinone/menaquinone biosynthesis C-methylase UbiE
LADEGRSRYIPALGVRWLTWIYDPAIRFGLREQKFKRRLIEQVGIQPGHRVLDLGCGTATLTLMLKEACPDATVVGLDGDPGILEIAHRKVARADVDVEIVQGMAFEPPFGSGSFDRVVSSLVIHHLSAENKRRTFARMKDLLKPGGELHIADWGQAQNVLMRLAFLAVQILDGFETTSENVRQGLVPALEETGFVSAEETWRQMTILGTLSLYRASR